MPQVSNDETAKEIRAGAEALISWFESQNTSPKMAVAIMSGVIVGIIVQLASEEHTEEELYETFCAMLKSTLLTRRKPKKN